MSEQADLAIFVAESLLAFRQRVEQVDPAFFSHVENQQAYLSLANTLPYVWVNQHGKTDLADLLPGGRVKQ